MRDVAVPADVRKGLDLPPETKTIFRLGVAVTDHVESALRQVGGEPDQPLRALFFAQSAYPKHASCHLLLRPAVGWFLNLRRRHGTASDYSREHAECLVQHALLSKRLGDDSMRAGEAIPKEY